MGPIISVVPDGSLGTHPFTIGVPSMKRLLLVVFLVLAASPVYAKRFNYVPNPGVFNFQDYWNVNTY
jgi:hypothetical protein